jgi:hypothetical protein
MNERERDSKLRGLELKLAVALVAPIALGAIVSAFLPWSEDRWPIGLAVALLAAVGTWLWLRHSIVRRLGVVARALESGKVADLRELPSGGGWGELSDVGETVSAFLTRQRALERDLEELAALRALVARLGDAATQWAETEEAPAWRGNDAGAGADTPAPGEELVARLEGASVRLEERRHEQAVVAGQVRLSVDGAGSRLRELSASAERQFLETTSLLTVLRELKRWSGELESVVETVAPLPSPAAEAGARAQALVHEGLDHAERWSQAATAATERLAETAADEVRVFDAARLAAVRAAAAALSGHDEARPAAEALATFLREAEAALSHAQFAERAARDSLAAQSGAIAELRERLTRAAVALAPPALPRADDPAIAARKALDRVREMVQDVLARGQRLVAAAERTSSEALRSSEDVVQAVDELDGLQARLLPSPPFVTAARAPGPARAAGGAGVAGEGAADAADEADADSGAAPADAARGPMRVLGEADLIDDDEVRFHGA